jgi:hypothetical protein
VVIKHSVGLVLAFGAMVGVSRIAPTAQQTASDGPQYTSGGKLMLPADYREWAYVTSGLGMTYGPARPAAGRPANFDNVFVNRESYRQFMMTGRWPEKTMFVLEVRSAEEQVSIDNGGRTQGPLIAIESAVKDRARFAEAGWGYFSFGSAPNLAQSAAALPTSESCYACHKNNTAVEQTFVQFYPTLFEVARRMGTVKPTYDPARKP